MSNRSGRDLFNISLTEIIIILFFVLMLFAIFRINDLYEEKKIIEKQNKSLLAQVNAKGDNISPNPIVENINPEAPVEDMTNQEKLDMINAAINRLKGYEKQDPEIASADVDPCEANPFECLPDCWELRNKAPSGRDYEYLFDIAICESSYFVQRAPLAELGEYTSANFKDVPNAMYLEDKFFKNADLEKLFGKIRKHGESQTRQCRYSVNLVDIESSKRELTFANTKSAIVNNFKVEKVDVDKIGYSNYLNRFPKNLCSKLKNRASDDKKSLSLSEKWDLGEENTGSLKQKVSINDCTYLGLKNREFILQLEALISKKGEILDFKQIVKTSDDKYFSLGRNERKIIDLIKDSIRKAKGDRFKNSRGSYDFSVAEEELNVGKDLCK